MLQWPSIIVSATSALVVGGKSTAASKKQFEESEHHAKWAKGAKRVIAVAPVWL